MLEKMLAVAISLREQENFDSLMGVLAGLNSQPIFRLSETFELVAAKLDGEQGTQRTEQPDGDKTRLPKKLRSLNRLMSANKAFAAYRLALANSGNGLIPYLCVSSLSSFSSSADLPFPSKTAASTSKTSPS